MTSPHVQLQQPLYGATFRVAVSRFLRKYATFTGRASQSEFWWAVLFLHLVTLVATIPYLITVVGQLMAVLEVSLLAASGTAPAPPTSLLGWSLASFAAIVPLMLVSLGLLVPTYALGARRLQDAGLSGWFILLSLATGGIFFYVAGFLPAKAEGLRFEPPGVVPVVPPGAHAPMPFGGAPDWQRASWPQQPWQPTAPGQQQQPTGRASDSSGGWVQAGMAAQGGWGMPSTGNPTRPHAPGDAWGPAAPLEPRVGGAARSSSVPAPGEHDHR